jgi:hypothetical protein
MIIDLLDDDNNNSNNNNIISNGIHTAAFGLSHEELAQQELLLEHYEIQRLDLQQQQMLPTSLQQYHHHPNYVLLRDLYYNQAIRPDYLTNPIAIIKGESVYKREWISELYSIRDWKKKLRQVKIEEQEKPAKILTRKSNTFRQQQSSKLTSFFSFNNNINTTSSSSSSSEMASIIKEIRLYGDWQTEAFDIPPVSIDGIIPFNEYGNLEIFDGKAKFVPKGAVYIGGAYAIKAAKNCGIQYVPAVTHFEYRNQQENGIGQYAPRINGCVVLEEDGPLVSDAAMQLEEHAALLEVAQKFRDIVSKWEKLTKQLIRRDELREKYGY